ncbi:MAG: multidrug ABC transporter [Gemmatimonadales bacterium]|nr:MAG: multidrug ABC transporter [Gemmatimonadales bacterium]
MTLARLCINRPVATSMLFAAVVFLGLISFIRLPIELLPDVSYPKLVVYTRYQGVGPAEVERFVTAPIEAQVSAVPGVQRVESVSREGVSLVILRFAWGTNMDFAALNVREKLDNLRGSLPGTADRPAILRTDPDAEPIMALSVSGRQDLWTLKDLAESVFKRRLEQIDGVAEAAVVGGLEREIHVEVDPRLLEAHGLTLQQIAQALDAANQSAPGGSILRGRYRYALRTLGEFRTVEEISAVPIAQLGAGIGANRSGAAPRPAGSSSPANNQGLGARASLTVGDIARVEDGFRERESMALYNGEEAVGLLLFKEAAGNTVRVAARVEEVLEQLRREYPEVRLEVTMSQAGFISEAINNVVQNLVQGAALAFLVLFLFLRNPRYPVVIALAIPISVVATFVLLDLFGVTLNVMSLGGLALGVGMLVDNSIVVLENIFRHRELGAGRDDAADRGATEVRAAITASTLTTIAVFGPIIYIEGVAGELFGALSLAVAFSLLASLFVAMTLLPMLAARWAAGDPARDRRRWAVLEWFDRGFERFAARYERILEYALDHRRRVVGVAVLLLAVAVGLGLALDRSVLPEVDQGAFQARVRLPRGTPLEETARLALRLDSIFRSDPEVESVFSRVGRETALTATLEEEEESGLNTAVLEVRLRPGAETKEALERVSRTLPPVPPGVLALETGAATSLGRLLGAGEADIAVRIRGDNLEQAFDYARRVQDRLASLPRLSNVWMGIEQGQPELQVEIDRDRAAAYAIEPQAIAQVVEHYMRGVRATEFLDFDRKVPVIVRLPEADRRSPETLRLMRVNGVPLRELVRTREALGPVEIRRLDQIRTVTVFADIERGGVDEAVASARVALADLSPPRGLRVEIGGESEELQRSLRDLAFAFGLALLLVFMILAAEFESLAHPFVILLSVPLAAIGAVLSLWLAGLGLNTMSLIGIIVLVGIVDNDAIVKVDFINRMRAEGLPVREAILAAGRARLRPILMTTVTTLFGVLPMALGFGRGAELRQPLAVAIFGGLFTATVLTLVVIPVAYSLVEEARSKLRARFRRAAA